MPTWTTKEATRPRRRGLTLIELVITVVVLGFAVPPLLAFFHESIHDGILAERQTQARFLAMEKMEELVADRHAAARGYDYLQISHYPIEDPIVGFAGFSRSVTITDVSPADLTSPQSGSGYRKVTVTVEYASPSGSFSLTCLFCDLPS